ncbi:LytTR family DNA-binding domain-containing protein [Candidatus Enterococcus mansonii]|uniref:HTH LytTR-type domain-containing protein n=1 Tax=Candidatus Enterococcus mansonii TaxID=1834181 RepID=A0ABU8IHR7_9ENTE
MLSVFIYEKNQTQKRQIESWIKNYIVIEEFNMEILLTTNNPNTLLEYKNKHSEKMGLYFIDINLTDEFNGIHLAAKIRELDSFGKIVFITAHKEFALQVFQHQIEALDFILKDNPKNVQKRIHRCLTLAEKRCQDERIKGTKILNIKQGTKITPILHENILFFETSVKPHKLILTHDKGIVEFSGSLNKIERLNENFFRCHRSYLVNKQHIIHLDKKNRELLLSDGNRLDVSVRKTQLLEMEQNSSIIETKK